MTPFEIVRSGADPSALTSGSDIASGLGAQLSLPPLPPTLSQSAIDAAAKAAQLWAASQRQRRQPCVMSPMDEMAYFSLPTVRYVAVNNSHGIQLCDANLMRTVLILSSYTGAFVSPDNSADSGASHGMFLYSQQGAVPYVAIRHDETPGLPQQAWFAGSSAANASVMVIELVLKNWPGK